jgi:hypothetical protein
LLKTLLQDQIEILRRLIDTKWLTKRIDIASIWVKYQNDVYLGLEIIYKKKSCVKIVRQLIRKMTVQVNWDTFNVSGRKKYEKCLDMTKEFASFNDHLRNREVS